MLDPLDIMTNRQNIIPYFQPIFTAENGLVMGYEVLGRYKDEDGFHSLGDFFHDETTPDEYKTEIDDDLLTKALAVALRLEDKPVIFLNRNANSLMADRGLTFLEKLQATDYPLDRIVIEITEHYFTGDMKQLNHIFSYFKTYGIRLALDNAGRGGSNLDRIRLLEPDILKIDLEILKEAATPLYYEDVLQSLTLLARKIGATLLYEGIEATYQLQYAWRNSGRYFQGYFFAKPSQHFVGADICQTQMEQEFRRFIKHEKGKINKRYETIEMLNHRMSQAQTKFNMMDFDQFAATSSELLSDLCFRIYICDENGLQVSANFLKGETEWQAQVQYKGKNWSWRPYFLENITHMEYMKKGILSDLYSDIETSETIRTFSYPLGKSHYLFADLPYLFIYEHDLL